MKIEENVTLAPYTTLGVGGPARYFVVVDTVEELKEAISFAKKEKLPLFVLGGGSNVLVSDNGFPGLVISPNFKGVTFKDIGDAAVEVTAYSGEDWDDFVKQCADKDLWGIENLSGIPGEVGAAPVQNIGAYGVELKDIFVSAEVFDSTTGEIKTFTVSDCQFGYRDSIFKKPGTDLLIISVTLRLHKDGLPNAEYKGIIDYIGEEKIKNQSVSDMRTCILDIRAEKGMVIHPNYESYKTAGSFFKNPIVSKSLYKEIQSNIPETPKYFVGDDMVKIPAAFLVERAGFEKGYTEGNVGISPKHTLALINKGGAKAKDFVKLSEKIQKKVFETFNIKLKPEVRFVGNFH